MTDDVFAQPLATTTAPRCIHGVASGVLVECSSVIVRLDAIHTRLPGGWRTFAAMVPNKTLCADMELARVGFMGTHEAAQFARRLEQLGLTYLQGGQAVDIAVIDSVLGLLTPCDWLDIRAVNLTDTGSRVTACCLRGATITRVAVPADWTFAGSLSQLLYVRYPAWQQGGKPHWYKLRGGPE